MIHIHICYSVFFPQHGESENNFLGKIGGDSDLSLRGQNYAETLAWLALILIQLFWYKPRM